MRQLATLAFGLSLLMTPPASQAATLGAGAFALLDPACCGRVGLETLGSARRDDGILSFEVARVGAGPDGSIGSVALGNAGIRLTVGQSFLQLTGLTVHFLLGEVRGTYEGARVFSGDTEFEVFGGDVKLFDLGGTGDFGTAVHLSDDLSGLLRLLFDVDVSQDARVAEFRLELGDDPVSPVPVPSALGLMATALAGLGLLRARPA